MKRLPLLLLLLGCGSELGPEGQAARAVCDTYCVACAPESERCPDGCFDEYGLFAGHETKAECSDEYLLGRHCQTTNGCDDPACGDPHESMRACSERIDNQ